ncbi:epoxide hydrolase N-terminal domain-containing protein [Sphingomonas sp. MMS24-JH45]
MIEPFRIHIPDARLADIAGARRRLRLGRHARRGRLASRRRPRRPAPPRRSLAGRLRLARQRGARLDELPQFMADVEGQRLHVVHVRGDGSRLPVLLVHGWPGSFIEFEQIVAPWLPPGTTSCCRRSPGYAFSGRPDGPIGPRRTAGLFHALMAMLYPGGRFVLRAVTPSRCDHQLDGASEPGAGRRAAPQHDAPGRGRPPRSGPKRSRRRSAVPSWPRRKPAISCSRRPDPSRSAWR